MSEITSILCAVDFSEYSERALAYAMRVAVGYGAKLLVLHVMPPFQPAVTDAIAVDNRELTERNLHELIARRRLPAADIETLLVESTDPPQRILECAEAFECDLIVTGSHGRGGAPLVLLGSVVEALLHRSSLPMLIVPKDLNRLADHSAVFSQIICAIDFSMASLNALALALAMAQEGGSHLTLLHIVDTPPELSHAPLPLDRFVAPLRAQVKASALQHLRGLVPARTTDSFRVDANVLEGGVAKQVLRVARQTQADLIVMGVHGRNVFDLAFFGSNSKDVIRQATCPVLIVPALRRSDASKQAS